MLLLLLLLWLRVQLWEVLLLLRLLERVAVIILLLQLPRVL